MNGPPCGQGRQPVCGQAKGRAGLCQAQGAPLCGKGPAPANGVLPAARCIFWGLNTIPLRPEPAAKALFLSTVHLGDVVALKRQQNTRPGLTGPGRICPLCRAVFLYARFGVGLLRRGGRGAFACALARLCRAAHRTFAVFIAVPACGRNGLLAAGLALPAPRAADRLAARRAAGGLLIHHRLRAPGVAAVIVPAYARQRTGSARLRNVVRAPGIRFAYGGKRRILFAIKRALFGSAACVKPKEAARRYIRVASRHGACRMAGRNAGVCAQLAPQAGANWLSYSRA